MQSKDRSGWRRRKNQIAACKISNITTFGFNLYYTLFREVYFVIVVALIHKKKTAANICQWVKKKESHWDLVFLWSRRERVGLSQCNGPVLYAPHSMNRRFLIRQVKCSAFNTRKKKQSHSKTQNNKIKRHFKSGMNCNERSNRVATAITIFCFFSLLNPPPSVCDTVSLIAQKWKRTIAKIVE